MTTHDNITLEIRTREPGKGPSGRLRKQKWIPGIVYGNDTENTLVALEEKFAVKYGSREFDNSLFILKSEDSKLNNKQVLIKDLDRDPVTRIPTHIDFYAPDMTVTVEVEVELRFEGKPEGVVVDGGQLQLRRRELEVSCLPNNIPDYIAVDVTALKMNETLHLSDIKLPEGVEATATEDIAICSVAEIKEIEVETAPAEGDALAAEGAEGETAGEGEAKAEGGEGEKKADAPANKKD